MVDTTRDELTRLLSELVALTFDGGPNEERRLSELASKIDAISPDPNWAEYIYQSDVFLGDNGRTDVDGVVTKISEYKPIRL